jgi:hypothetical protein
MATASLWRQFCAMVRKNSLLKRRMWKTAFAETLCPVLFVGLMSYLRSLSTTIEDPNRMYVDRATVGTCQFPAIPGIPPIEYPCFNDTSTNLQIGNIHIDYLDNDRADRLHATNVRLTPLATNYIIISANLKLNPANHTNAGRLAVPCPRVRVPW